MSDLLERATRALRETSETPEPRSGLTRGRILDAAEKRYGSRRSPFMRWAIALTAVFAASTALARVAEYWPEIRRALTPETSEPSERHAPRAGKPRVDRARPVDEPPAPAERKTPAPAENTAPAETPAAAEPESSAAPQLKPSPVAAPPESPPARPARREPRPVERARRAGEPQTARTAIPASAPPIASSEPSTPAPESAELGLFRRAQRLHLDRDPGALAAWDAYLRVASDGVLAPEARYNRALCLVRLGRAGEAREALEPFARGEHAGFRQREAEALLKELAR
jgi:hypothetical protein